MSGANKFAETARRILIGERSRDEARTVGDIAPRIGLSYDSLYARLVGRSAFRLSEALGLLGALEDRRLADALLHESPFVAVDRHLGTATPGFDSVRQGAAHTVLEAADVLRMVESELRDKALDHRSRHLINAEIEEAERALAALRALVNRN